MGTLGTMLRQAQLDSGKNVAKARCCFAFVPRAKARGNGLVVFDCVKKNIFFALLLQFTLVN